MNYFSISSLIIVMTTLPMAFFLLKEGHRQKRNLIWSLLCLTATIWGIGAYVASNSLSPEVALHWWKIAYIGVIFAPVLYLHFVFDFLDIKNFYSSLLLYSLSILFLFLNFSPKNYLIGGISYMFNQFYYIDWTVYKSPLFVIFYVAYYWIFLLIPFFFIVKHFSVSTGLRHNQLKYLIGGSVIAWMGPHGCFLPCFGLGIYPFTNIFLAIYPILIGYAIIRYHLLDITIMITRMGIFVVVYSIVLGIPFVLAFGWREQLKSLMGETWWLVPLISSTVLATIGPSIYLFIQKKAEDRLLQEQRRYQTTLRRASLGMGRVKDLRRLLKLTVNIVTRTVRIEHCEIYLSHKLSERYILKASQGWSLADDKRISFIPVDAPLIQYLKRHREPLVYDEVKQRGQDFNDQVLEEIGKIMEELDAALLVPSFIEEELLAILVLGKKRSGKLYSHDDLIVFSILANQAALAIENAQFYEDMKKTHDQLMKAEKMATIGTMADGLSHQINNRLHAMGFIASDALDTIKLQPKENLPPEAKKVYEEMEVSLGKIQENVKRGGEIVEGLLKYSRKTDEGFAAIDLGKLLDAAFEMVQFKIKLSQIDIARDFNGAIPKIRGNFTQLQEVFFNMVDNSYDAMMQRKEEMKEPGYRGRLEISAQEEGSHLEILIKDNGMGVKEKDFKRLFTPFFTTKLSSKKGTGLGLYVIRKIIEENHGGKVEFTSEYQKGSQTRLVLPIAA